MKLGKEFYLDWNYLLFCFVISYFFCILQEEQHGWVPYKYKLVFNPNPANPKTRDFVTILPAPHLIHHYRQVITVVEFYSGGCEIPFFIQTDLKVFEKMDRFNIQSKFPNLQALK